MYGIKLHDFKLSADKARGVRYGSRILGLTLLLAWAFSVPASAGSEDVVARPDTSGLTLVVDQLFSRWDNPTSPGIAIGIIKEGELLFTRSYGMANLEYRIPNSSTTIFHVASVSKQFTTMAVGLLVEEGHLSLDDDIREYLPEVPDFGNTITVQHLISHTSGLRDQWDLLRLAGWRLDDVITTRQILRLIERQEELNFEPGTEHLYSNTGYTLLALLVERITGQSFRDFADERIFRPLGMRNTHFHDRHTEVVPGRAYSYGPLTATRYEHMVLSYATVGATSLMTTVEDMARWDRNFYTAEVGSTGLIARMAEPGILNNGNSIPYGYALSLGRYRGLVTVSHGGNDAGFRSFYLRFPEQKMSIVLLSNAGDVNAPYYGYRLADLLLEPHFETSTGTVEELQQAILPSDSETLEEFSGTYTTVSGGRLHVELEEGKLFVQGGDTKVEMIRVGKNEFVAEDSSVNLRVSFVSEGDVRSSRADVFLSGSRLPTFTSEDLPAVNAEVFEEYAGEFHSRELGTSYTFRRDGDRLIRHHVRHDEQPLVRIADDTFVDAGYGTYTYRFTRSDDGSVDGFHVTTARVRDLRFSRVTVNN